MSEIKTYIIDGHNTYMAKEFIMRLTLYTPKYRNNIISAVDKLCKNPEHKTNWDEILNFLEHKNFIRYEWDKDGGLTSLTEYGDSLKRFGDFEPYFKSLEIEKNKIIAAELRQQTNEQRNVYLFWISVSIAVSTAVSAVYYMSELMNGDSIHLIAGLLFFLFGTIAGLLIALLLLELRSKRKP